MLCPAVDLNISLFLPPPPSVCVCVYEQKYNPRTDQWTTRASLPIQRSGFGSAVVDGFLFLAGGCNNLSKVKSVDRYDADKDEWDSIANMTLRRSGLAVGVAPAFLY